MCGSEPVKVGETHTYPESPNRLTIGAYLKLEPGQIGPIEGKGKPAKIAMTKARRIQDIDRFVIKTFHHGAG